MKRLLAILLFGLMAPAQAQSPSCLDATQAWSWTYQNDPITSITYYLDSQVLNTHYASGIVHLMADVPITTATRFQHIGWGQSPDPTWAQVRYSFKEILQGAMYCPLLAQNGAYLLSAPQRDVPH